MRLRNNHSCSQHRPKLFQWYEVTNHEVLPLSWHEGKRQPQVWAGMARKAGNKYSRDFSQPLLSLGGLFWEAFHIITHILHLYHN